MAFVAVAGLRSLRFFVGAGLIVAAGGCLAQTIHKCTTGDETVYQSMPCPPGATDRVLDGIAPSRPATIARAPAARAAPSFGDGVRRLFQRTRLALGMTDDEVLNLASWGRPSAIGRHKSGRIWHEEWVYRWGSGGESRLFFANGRLTDAELDAAQPAPPVSITLR